MLKIPFHETRYLDTSAAVIIVSTLPEDQEYTWITLLRELEKSNTDVS